MPFIFTVSTGSSLQGPGMVPREERGRSFSRGLRGNELAAVWRSVRSGVNYCFIYDVGPVAMTSWVPRFEASLAGLER